MHQDLRELMSRMADLNENYSRAIAGLSNPRRSTGREDYGRAAWGRTSGRMEYTRDQESMRERASNSGSIQQEILTLDAALQEVLDRLYPNIQDLFDAVYAPLRGRADEYQLKRRPELSVEGFENPPDRAYSIGPTYAKLKYLSDVVREEQTTLAELINNRSLKEGAGLDRVFSLPSFEGCKLLGR